MNSFLYGAFYSFLMLSILVAIEYVTRKKNYPKEVTRSVSTENNEKTLVLNIWCANRNNSIRKIETTSSKPFSSFAFA